MLPGSSWSRSFEIARVLICETRLSLTCISTATEALPKITGLVVKRSRTRPVSPAILASWKGQSKPVIVDVDVETEGDAQTFSYMCVVTQGSAFVQRTMN